MTSRDLTASMLTAIAAGTVRPAIFCELQVKQYGSPLEYQYVRLFTGVGTLSWNGVTWTGGGHLLSISPLEETADVQAVGFNVQVSGMPSGNIDTAINYLQQGLSGKLWLGLFDVSGAIIADPYLLRRGKFDIAIIERAGDTCTISAQYEDRLIDLDKPRGRRYTTEDQRLDYPSDLGFEFVPSLQDLKITWG